MGSVPSDEARPPFITTFIIAGVSGSGKSTVGKQLAARLGSEFFDGDDFHTAANKGECLQLQVERYAPVIQRLLNAPCLIRLVTILQPKCALGSH